MTRLTRSAALGLAIAAVAAPAASADPHAQDPNYPVQAVAIQDLRSPDARDASEGRGTFNAPEVTVVRVPATAPVAPPPTGSTGTTSGSARPACSACR